MLTPPRAIGPNSHIGVAAISSPSELDRIEIAKRELEEEFGFRVTLAGNIGHRHRGYLAGTDDERAAELNRLLRDPFIDAIFFSRGGYGAMRLLDLVDYDAIRANPRPIIGFSDITALHQAMAVKAGVAGFHGPMLNLDFHNRLPYDIADWFRRMLAGEAPMAWHFDPSQVVCEGEAEGVLFGGCLSLTTRLIATPYDFWVDDGIWFFEDVDEAVYRIDRMLIHLRLSGRMQKIRGVVIGKLKGCGSEAEMVALLQEFFGSSRIPVVRDFPFGHHGDNLLMPVGAPVRLSTRDNTFTVIDPAVQR